MIARSVERALYLLAAMLSTAAGWITTRPLHPRAAVQVTPSLGSVPREHPTTDSLADAIALIAAENLFRPERASAPDADASTGAGNGVPLNTPPKPNLVLKGVLGGPPWDAILDGVPGHAGSVVVRTGQRINELEVRAFRHDTVFIKGMDTTWKLTLRHP